MSNEFFISWLKTAVVITAVFLAVGFGLDIAVNGFTTAEALSRLKGTGLYQSALFAMAVATLLTWHKK